MPIKAHVFLGLVLLQAFLMILTNMVYQHPIEIGGILWQWDIFTLTSIYISSIFIVSRYGFSVLCGIILIGIIPTFISTLLSYNGPVEEIWMIDFVFSDIVYNVAEHIALSATVTFVATNLIIGRLYLVLRSIIPSPVLCFLLSLFGCIVVDTIIFFTLMSYVVEGASTIGNIFQHIGIKMFFVGAVMVPILLMSNISYRYIYK